MISIYFGVPGSGKSTHACWLVKKAKKRHYERVYSNFPIKGVTTFNSSDLGFYDFAEGHNTLLIVDECSIDFNNRKYKSLSKECIQFAKLHRHYNCDIVMYSQSYDDMDITFRRLASEYFIVCRGLLKWFTHTRRISKKIGIDEQSGQIIDKYNFAPMSLKIIFNPPLWKMFDSWDAPVLPSFPKK